MDPYVAIGAIFLALLLGYVLGRITGHREIRAYKEAQPKNGGPCWVKGCLPPGADL